MGPFKGAAFRKISKTRWYVRQPFNLVGNKIIQLLPVS